MLPPSVLAGEGRAYRWVIPHHFIPSCFDIVINSSQPLGEKKKITPHPRLHTPIPFAFELGSSWPRHHGFYAQNRNELISGWIGAICNIIVGAPSSPYHGHVSR